MSLLSLLVLRTRVAIRTGRWGVCRLQSGIHKESEDQDMNRGMITSIDTVTQVSIKFREKKKVNRLILITGLTNK